MSKDLPLLNLPLSLPERGEAPLRASDADITRMSPEQIEKLMHELQVELERRVIERTAELAATNERLKAEIAERAQVEETLRRSEERLRHVLQIETVGVLFFDDTGTIIDANKTFLDQTGFTREDVEARQLTWQRLTPPEWLDASREQLKQFEVTRRIGPYEKEYFRKDGSRWWFVFAGASLGDGTIVEFCIDIDARKKAEQALRESEERFRTMADGTPMMIWVTDSRGQFEFANRAFREFFGSNVDAVRGGGWHLLVHPDDAAAIGERVLAAYRDQRLYKVQARVRRHDGQWRWIECQSQPRFSASKEFLGMAGSSRDITEKKEAEEALEESRARFEGIVSSAMDAIITTDESRRIVLFNTAAEKMFACNATEALGVSLERFIPPPLFMEGHPDAGVLAKTVTTGPTALGSLEAQRANGEKFPIEASISETAIHGRKLYTIIMRDITDRLRTEAEMTARTRHERAVADLSRQALAGCDLEWLSRQAAEAVAETLEVEFSNVLELGPSGGELLLRAGVGWSEGCVGAARVPAHGESQASYTLRMGDPILVEDLTKDTRFRAPALFLDHSVVSGMSAVICGRSQPYGILGAHSVRKRRFSVHEAHFLQSVADVLAEAILRRQLEEELLAIANREQLRIGHDLHDGLCQQLAGIEFRTEALARKLSRNPDALREAEKIGALLRDSMREARVLSHSLAPVDLETNGLMSALGELAKSCGQLYRTDCKFYCDPPVAIANQDTATHLYRIAQEAISNAVRHGRAKTIITELRRAGAETVLTITNDGLPLLPNPKRSGRMGLRIMHYRAEMIGAVLRIASTAEGKTAVVCSFKAG